MRSGAWLSLALPCSVIGIAFFALAMDGHWQQVCGLRARAGRGAPVVFRAIGGALLLLSLLLCLRADHASMAALVWLMSLGVGAMLTAFALAWRPGWLSWLVLWAAGDRTETPGPPVVSD